MVRELSAVTKWLKKSYKAIKKLIGKPEEPKHTKETWKETSPKDFLHKELLGIRNTLLTGKAETAAGIRMRGFDMAARKASKKDLHKQIEELLEPAYVEWTGEGSKESQFSVVTPADFTEERMEALCLDAGFPRYFIDTIKWEDPPKPLDITEAEPKLGITSNIILKSGFRKLYYYPYDYEV